MLFRLLARLPLRALYAFSGLIAFTLRYVFRYRTKVIHDNLHRAFPDLTENEVARVAAAFYRNLADVLVETLKASRVGKDELADRVRITNPEIFATYLQNEQPIIVVGSHQANWEWVFLACSAQLPFPLEGVYRPLHSRTFDRFMHDMRSRFGARMIRDKDALKEVVRDKTLRAVSLIADQRPPRKEARYWTRFLNQDTAFYTGWARLAQFTGYPVLYADRERVARGRYEVTFRLIGEPPYPRKVDSLVETFARELERSIESSPSAWLWTHERWREKKPLYA